MKGKWIITGNHIALQAGGVLYHPSAEEMYPVIFGGNSALIEDIDCENLSIAFPKMKFSKVGTDIRCEISGEDGIIRAYLCCERKDKTIPVDFINGHIIDHCVYENEWFYITGSTKEIEDAFVAAGIDSCGNISISQYIEILKRKDSFIRGTLHNSVQIDYIDKPITEGGVIPTGINADLYPYQKIGYRWMLFMLKENGGCILGDEMGLGKTLQIITVLQEYKNHGMCPSLVIAPVSLLQNWKRECEKFAPALNLIIHHGSHRTGRYRDLEAYDVVVISYNTAVSDTALLKMINWNLVVLDEAQNIKNSESERAKYVKKIPKKAGVAVTGTPFENHVSDIWSLVDFICPGLFGTLSEYERYVSDDIDGAEKVEPLLSPLMIRRMVSDVAKDLPEKIVVPQPIEMSEVEALKYEEYRKEASNQGYKFDPGELQRMRMYCTHPQVCDEDVQSDPFSVSVKYQRLCEIIAEILVKKEKVILFTSFQKMFDILEEDIRNRFDIPVMIINGTVPQDKRQLTLDEFEAVSGSALLVLNPRVAGTGLNITSANHVIHYTLEWNPAVEDQASARSYRRGQKKTVFVYRLYYINTVEQIVNERIERKRDMAEKAIVGTEGTIENREDLIRAFSISPIR